MKQTIENIIKKNLPEKKEGDAYSKRLERQVLWTDIGFNQALSQIDTALIADEVLKVVGGKIEKRIAIHRKLESEYVGSIEEITKGIKGSNPHTFVIEQLEDLLSPKEN